MAVFTLGWPENNAEVKDIPAGPVTGFDIIFSGCPHDDDEHVFHEWRGAILCRFTLW